MYNKIKLPCWFDKLEETEEFWKTVSNNIQYNSKKSNYQFDKLKILKNNKKVPNHIHYSNKELINQGISNEQCFINIIDIVLLNNVELTLC